LPKGAKAMLMLVLHMEDPAAASAWDEFLPKLVGEIAGEKPAAPLTETVAGVKVYSLPATGLPWKSAIHFARKDAVLVIGQDRKLVGAAVAPDAVNSVVGDKTLSLPSGDHALVGTLSVGDLLGMIELPTTKGQPRFFDPYPVERLGGKLPEEQVLKDVDKARAAFLAAFGQLPPAAISVRRFGDELKLEIFQPKVQNGGLTPVINAGLQWFEKLMSLRDPNNYPIERNIYGEKW
jgi:hypothetical protein